MVFVLYRINNFDVRMIAAYESEEDALIDKNDIENDMAIDNQDENRKYYVTDLIYYKDSKKEQKPMYYSEEDCNIDEEDYYNLVAKSKDQTEQINILNEEVAFLRKKYSSIVREFSNESYIQVLSWIIIVVLLYFY